MEQIRSFLKVQRGERKPLLLLFLYLMLALASFTIARAVRDSLFLDQYGAINLPYAYLAIAVVISAVVSLYVRLAARLSQATLITATLLFFILNLILFWWAAPRGWDALPALFYVWTSIYGIIVTAQVWTVAGMILDTRQARRLFPLLGSGGILGAFLGGVFAAVAVRSAAKLRSMRSISRARKGSPARKSSGRARCTGLDTDRKVSATYSSRRSASSS